MNREQDKMLPRMIWKQELVKEKMSIGFQKKKFVELCQRDQQEMCF